MYICCEDSIHATHQLCMAPRYDWCCVADSEGWPCARIRVHEVERARAESLADGEDSEGWLPVSVSMFQKNSSSI